MTATAPTHLLLLPSPPWPATSNEISAAYGVPLTSTLKQLAQDAHKSGSGTSLDIAVPAPFLYERSSESRGSLYDDAQVLLAGLYKLICVIAAKHAINVENAEGIDARIVFVAEPRQAYQQEQSAIRPPQSSRAGYSFGPVIDMETLARSQRPWALVFSVASESGEQVLERFTKLNPMPVKVVKVGGGVVLVRRMDGDNDGRGAKGPVIHHSSIAVGGTWDHIHIGHKLLLTMFAFLLEPSGQGDKERGLTVGITGDEMLRNKKYADLLQDWTQRQASALAFLRAIMDFRPAKDALLRSSERNEAGPNGHAIDVSLDARLVIKLVEIADPFGPTITDESITGLVLSGETRSGGKAVNDKRSSKGWPLLQVFEVDVLDAEEEGEDKQVGAAFDSKLSSTTIRKALHDGGKIRSKA